MKIRINREGLYIVQYKNGDVEIYTLEQFREKFKNM